MAKPVNQEPPKIEFPCRYSIRVLGEGHDQFIDRVVEIIQGHAPELKREHAKAKNSSKGTWLSVHVVIDATGEEQLAAIHMSLKAYASVKMVI
ncbi:Uncharacterised protein [BD1-7 clade bacterium]|uniref:UPF0250 protein DPBNPPHM_04127 n=1 Tax=BD1-7 clade bacterium TaxID=2029982 RepID=A0A5S9PW42_9GAMM|nr:Uncharacterised protein [BD1-7 clade bacterium]CAA0108907.1 Uncharacterised protein [BD1-7 clade bacterium]